MFSFFGWLVYGSNYGQNVGYLLCLVFLEDWFMVAIMDKLLATFLSLSLWWLVYGTNYGQIDGLLLCLVFGWIVVDLFNMNINSYLTLEICFVWLHLWSVSVKKDKKKLCSLRQAIAIYKCSYWDFTFLKRFKMVP